MFPLPHLHGEGVMMNVRYNSQTKAFPVPTGKVHACDGGIEFDGSERADGG